MQVQGGAGREFHLRQKLNAPMASLGETIEPTRKRAQRKAAATVATAPPVLAKQQALLSCLASYFVMCSVVPHEADGVD
jgi:hypothetical protein